MNDSLSRRERQIMDILHHAGRATVGEVLERLADPPSYSAVRALLRILEDKGHARHVEEGLRYVYLPAQSPEHARQKALRHLVKTFFGGSPEKAVVALLDDSDLSEADVQRLKRMIEKTRKEGR